DLRVTWLLPLVWFCLACDRVRHAPLFGIAVALAVPEVFPSTRWAAALNRRGSDLFVAPSPKDTARVPRLGAMLIPFAVVAVALVCQMRGTVIPVLGRGWAQLDATVWPVGLVEPLRQIPPGTRVFNELNFGGFLICYAPQLPIFIDDRCELYGDEFLREYDQVARQDPARIEQWARRFDFDTALAQSGSPIDAHLADAG